MVVTNDDIRFTNESPYIDNLEWEGLQKKYKIGKYGGIKSRFLPQGFKTMEVHRDENYKINGKLIGDIINREDMVPLEYNLQQPKHKQIYNIYKISDIVADYEMNCSVTNLIFRGSRNGDKFEAKFAIDFVRRDFHNTSKTSWLTEWFLNGKNIPYGGSIHSKLLKKYEITMKEPSTPILAHSHELHQDFLFGKSHKFCFESYNDKGYLFVEFKDKTGVDRYFTIQSVPDNYGPSWSENIAIEYKKEWWIPSPEERTQINEIVSFLIGRQLISVGYTEYDKKGLIIKDCVKTPQIAKGIHLQELCKDKYISSPVNTIEGNPWENNLSTYLKKIIPNYLSLRDELKLDDVLEKYWLSKSIPIEAEIIVLAASLETLFNAWYKSKKSKSKRKYISHKLFNRIIEKCLKSIEKNLNTIDFEDNPDFRDRILRKIQNSYQMGYNESVAFFFKEIDLKIGKIEEETIKYRNKPVHGNLNKNEDTSELHKMTNAYRTLLNRSILKILGYEKHYIDYYTALEPVPIKEYVRHIDEPIGEKS